MQTECSAELSVFGRVEGRPVVAAFDGGALTSDAAAFCWAPRTEVLIWFDGYRDVSAMRETRGSSNTRSRPSSGSGCSASRSAMKTSTTMTSFATIL